MARGEIGKLKKVIWERDNYTCFYCYKDMRESYELWRAGKLKRMHLGGLTVDHIIPRSRGGLFTMENLITSCYSCNSKRGNRDFREYEIEVRGMLPLFEGY